MPKLRKSLTFLSLEQREFVNNFNAKFLSYFECTLEDLTKKDRSRCYVYLRAIYSYVLLHKGFTYMDIARLLKLKQHETIINYKDNFIMNKFQTDFQEKLKGFKDYYYGN
jgi:chromosomal replication initiation ATPase DnaA